MTARMLPGITASGQRSPLITIMRKCT